MVDYRLYKLTYTYDNDYNGEISQMKEVGVFPTEQEAEDYLLKTVFNHKE